MSLGNCKLKQWDITTHLQERPKSTPSVVDAEQQELTFTVSRNAKWGSHFGRHKLISIAFLGIYPKELKTYPHKNLHMDVCNNFTHNYQNLEATKVSSSRWIDKQTVTSKQWDITPPQKKKSYQAMKRHGGTLRSQWERLHTISFQLYDVLEKGKIMIANLDETLTHWQRTHRGVQACRSKQNSDICGNTDEPRDTMLSQTHTNIIQYHSHMESNFFTWY